MDQTLGFQDFLRIARRRIPYAVAPFLLIAVAAVSIVLLLPAIYRSTGTVTVEAQQIPSELVRSTVLGSADERIGYIKQLVMTDAGLEEIIRRFALYPDVTAASPMPMAIAKLRANVTVAAVRDPYDARQTIAFTVSFDHPDPVMARDVAADLVQLFLAENARTRSARASETAAFLRQETQRLSNLARTLDQKVAEFKQKNSDALPEHLDIKVNLLQRVDLDLSAVQRDIAATDQERRFLENQLRALPAQVPVRRDATSAELTPEERLQVLKADLARASALYTDTHPDVVRFKRMITQTETELARQGRGKAGGEQATPRDPERAELEAQIATAQTRLGSLRNQEQELSARMATLQAQILKTPEVEQGLRQMSLDYQAASREYDDVRSRLQQAELAENLESEQMAERFILLEPPAIAIRPARPDRLRFLAVGIILALAGGAGVAFAAELLDNRVQDPTMLTALIGERPLAVLPYIERAHERGVRLAAVSVKWLAFGAMLGASVMVGMHYVDPLRGVLLRLYY